MLLLGMQSNSASGKHAHPIMSLNNKLIQILTVGIFKYTKYKTAGVILDLVFIIRITIYVDRLVPIAKMFKLLKPP